MLESQRSALQLNISKSKIGSFPRPPGRVTPVILLPPISYAEEEANIAHW